MDNNWCLDHNIYRLYTISGREWTGLLDSHFHLENQQNASTCKKSIDYESESEYRPLESPCVVKDHSTRAHFSTGHYNYTGKVLLTMKGE